VAVVAGATRGAGRGIARMLGEAGATVYCTGRSSRTQPNTSSHPHASRPETIEETAELVSAEGGNGVAVRVDHGVEAEVASLFQRVWRREKRLDVLAIALTGQPHSWKSFLDDPPNDGQAYVDGWIRPHVITAWHAAKLMVKRKSGLIVDLVEGSTLGYHGSFYFDVMETLLKRLTFGLANDLGKHGVTSLSIGPGFMRTEAILDGYGVTEATWKNALAMPQAAVMGWGGSESTCFVGRAVAALAADPDVARRNGTICTARALAADYGFTDLAGASPDFAVLDAAVEEAKRTMLAPMVEAARLVKVDWTLTPTRGSDDGRSEE
jgi:NAD(P)-dependent dehydrogenase (short-subunit alcohol dehydrogenase family)